MERTVAPRIAAEQARSWLLVPAGKPEGFEAAHASAADAVSDAFGAIMDAFRQFGIFFNELVE